MILRYRLYKFHTLFLVVTLIFVVHFYLIFSQRDDTGSSRFDLDIDGQNHHHIFVPQISQHNDIKDNLKRSLDDTHNSSTSISHCACFGNLKDKNVALLEGKQFNNSGYLTIGIPTVRRPNADYLFKTLTSLIDNLDYADQRIVKIIIFLADFDDQYKLQRVQQLKKTYQTWLNSGLLQIVHAPRWYYPKLDHLKRNYNDSPQRVYWRSKQCIDYAFLFEYSAKFSQYYMQLEDDVITFHGYFDIIRNYIHHQRHKNWSSIHFSTLGYIGKLYRSSDIIELGRFFYMFYDEHPVDYLINFYSNLKMLPPNLVYLPSLFQHIGIKSSLKGKSQRLKDIQFSMKRVYNSNNPPAKVTATLQSYGGTEPEFAYSKIVAYYWCKQPLAKDTVTLIFDDYIRLIRAAVLTGDKARRRDCFHTALLQVSNNYHDHHCTDWITIGNFEKYGKIDIIMDKNNRSLPNNRIKCLRIFIPRKYHNWVILREIAVWSEI